jgi:hypothetical protein
MSRDTSSNGFTEAFDNSSLPIGIGLCHMPH